MIIKPFKTIPPDKIEQLNFYCNYNMVEQACVIIREYILNYEILAHIIYLASRIKFNRYWEVLGDIFRYQDVNEDIIEANLRYICGYNHSSYAVQEMIIHQKFSNDFLYKNLYYFSDYIEYIIKYQNFYFRLAKRYPEIMKKLIFKQTSTLAYEVKNDNHYKFNIILYCRIRKDKTKHGNKSTNRNN